MARIIVLLVLVPMLVKIMHCFRGGPYMCAVRVEDNIFLFTTKVEETAR